MMFLMSYVIFTMQLQFMIDYKWFSILSADSHCDLKGNFYPTRLTDILC
jgi:hypothetical protein